MYSTLVSKNSNPTELAKKAKKIMEDLEKTNPDLHLIFQILFLGDDALLEPIEKSLEALVNIGEKLNKMDKRLKELEK